MKMPRVLLYGLLMLSAGRAQMQPLPSAIDTTQGKDTLMTNDREQRNGDRPDSLAGNSMPFPRTTKVTIIEDRVFDLSAQPVDVAEKEMRTPTLGRRYEGAFLLPPKAFNSHLSVGFGNYTTPYVSGWIGTASLLNELLLRGTYTSTKGSEEFRDARSAHASLSARWYLSDSASFFPSGRIQASAALLSDRYRLYGSDTPQHLRSFDRIESALAVESHESSVQSLKIHLLNATVEKQRETSASLNLSFSTPLRSARIVGETEVWVDGRTRSLGSKTVWYSALTLGGTARFGVVDVVVGIRASYDEDELECGRGLVRPHARIVWFAAPSVTVFASFESSVMRRSFRHLVEANPFVMVGAPLRNTDVVMNAALGASIETWGMLKASAVARLQRAHALPYFQASHVRQFDVLYSGTSRTLSFELDAYIETRGTLLGAKLTLQQSRLEEAFALLVPYAPRWRVVGSVKHAFAPQVRVGSEVRFLDERFADAQNTRLLKAVPTWDAHIEYGERLFVRGEIINILDRSEGEWEGYGGERRRVMLGLGYTW
ncbi:MAG: hypothetical protein C4326_11810 [Ignavibacteria bacterium]